MKIPRLLTLVCLFLFLFVVSVSAATFSSSTIRYGLKNNNDVRTLQQLLISKGYLNSVATGNFYSQTLAAVKAYQRANKLPPDGIVGRKTQANLLSGSTAASSSTNTTASASPSPISNTAGALSTDTALVSNLSYGLKNNEEVRRVQKILITKGFLSNTTATGNFLSATRQAVIEFQKANGIPATGTVGPLTIKALLGGSGEGVSSLPTITPPPVPTSTDSSGAATNNPPPASGGGGSTPIPPVPPTPIPPDTTLPSTPTSVIATAASSSQINLSWTASTDNVLVIGYKIFRCGSAGCTPTTQIGTSTSSSYLDSSLAPSTSYSYKVSAVDTALNNSAFSSIATATTTSVSAADTIPPSRTLSTPSGTLAAGTTSVNLTLTTSENATCKYGFSANTPFTSLANTFAITGGSSHSTLLSGLINAAGYSSYIKCKDLAGNENTDDYTITFSVASISDTTPPARTLGLPSGSLTSGTTSTNLTLTTSEGSTCKYSTTANTAYASMASTFSTTGALIHSTLVTGLTNSSSYNYYVKCRDGANNANTDDYTISFSVASAPLVDTTPPIRTLGVPSGSLTTGTTSTNLTLTTNENSTCKYSTSANTSYTSMSNTFSATGATTHLTLISSLTNGSSYNYYVRCRDVANNANIDDYTISFSVANVVDTTPPTRTSGAPSGSLASSTTQATLTLSTNESATCKYSSVANTAYASMSNTFSTTGATTHSTLVTALTSGSSYNYYVRCRDGANNSNTDDYTISFSVAASAPAGDTTPPVVAAGLISVTTPGVTGGTFLKSVPNNRVDLSWIPSTDNVAVTGYKILRCIISGFSCPVPLAQIGTSATNSYTDSGLLSNTVYSYNYTAYDAAGNNSTTATGIQVLTGMADITPPSTPSGLSAVAISTTQINLTWTGSTDAVGVTGYKILRCSGAGCTPSSQAGTSTTTSYSDTGLTPGTPYSYKVTANDAAGNNSISSNTASIATPATADVTPPSVPTITATVISTFQINLSWTPSTDNSGVITNYKIFRCSLAGCTPPTTSPIVSQIATSYSDGPGLTPGTSYTYAITASDAAGNNSLPNNTVTAITLSGSDITPPSVPTGITVTTPGAVGGGIKTMPGTRVDFTWTASTDNSGAVTSYKVLRCVISGFSCVAPMAQIDTTPTNSYSQIGLPTSTIYYYAFKATDAAGNESASSTPLMIITGASSQGLLSTHSLLATAYEASLSLGNTLLSLWDSYYNFFQY